jgi:hypothetical protein
MRDDELRAAYGARASTPRDEERADCPPPETLQGLVDRTLPEADRVRLVQHVAGCPRCRGEIELLRSFAETAERLAPGRTRRRRWPILALAVLVAGGIGLSLQYRAPTKARGPARDTTGALGLHGPGSVAPDGAVRLAWRPAPGAERYRVRVLDAGGAIRYDARTGDTVVTIPRAKLEGAAGPLRWEVRAALPGGRELRSATAPLALPLP